MSTFLGAGGPSSPLQPLCGCVTVYKESRCSKLIRRIKAHLLDKIEHEDRFHNNLGRPLLLSFLGKNAVLCFIWVQGPYHGVAMRSCIIGLAPNKEFICIATINNMHLPLITVKLYKNQHSLIVVYDWKLGEVSSSQMETFPFKNIKNWSWNVDQPFC